MAAASAPTQRPTAKKTVWRRKFNKWRAAVRSPAVWPIEYVRKCSPYAMHFSRRRDSDLRCCWQASIQIVHFHESNSSSVIYTTNDRGVVTRWQRSYDRRLASRSRSVAAALDGTNLVIGDDP